VLLLVVAANVVGTEATKRRLGLQV